MRGKTLRQLYDLAQTGAPSPAEYGVSIQKLVLRAGSDSTALPTSDPPQPSYLNRSTDQPIDRSTDVLQPNDPSSVAECQTPQQPLLDIAHSLYESLQLLPLLSARHPSPLVPEPTASATAECQTLQQPSDHCLGRSLPPIWKLCLLNFIAIL